MRAERVAGLPAGQHEPAVRPPPTSITMRKFGTLVGGPVGSSGATVDWNGVFESPPPGSGPTLNAPFTTGTLPISWCSNVSGRTVPHAARSVRVPDSRSSHRTAAPRASATSSGHGRWNHPEARRADRRGPAHRPFRGADVGQVPRRRGRRVQVRVVRQQRPAAARLAAREDPAVRPRDRRREPQQRGDRVRAVGPQEHQPARRPSSTGSGTTAASGTPRRRPRPTGPARPRGPRTRAASPSARRSPRGRRRRGSQAGKGAGCGPTRPGIGRPPVGGWTQQRVGCSSDAGTDVSEVPA